MKESIAFLLVIVIALLAVIAWELQRGQIEEERPTALLGIPHLEVKDLFAIRPVALPEGSIRISDGKIVAIDSLAPKLRFKYATEKEPGNVIQVESDRNPPENFRVGIGASIKGTYDREKKFFKAYQVSTNCPSRYEELKKIEERQKDDPLPE